MVCINATDAFWYILIHVSSSILRMIRLSMNLYTDASLYGKYIDGSCDAARGVFSGRNLGSSRTS